jgi:GrpB-like predicted nucleotidyltransferase (UPF0157 family)
MKYTTVIAGYDPQWPLIYEEEKARILRVIGHRLVAIEHIGSTSVPGLGAKPIIDISAAVHRLSDADECIEPLRSIGYKFRSPSEVGIPERRYFNRGPADVPNQHFHLHIFELTSDFWRENLLFRDFLRNHPDVASQYYELKKELAARYVSDTDAYTEAKRPFIESVLAQAISQPQQL